MTYGQWLKNWLKVYKMPYVKNWKTIKRNIELHIPGSLKKMKLIDITSFDIQSALLSVKTSRVRVEIYDIYHGSLSMAYKVGFIDKDITTALIKPKHKRVVGSALTPGEVVAFRYLIRNHRLRNYYEFCLLTGCRRSEALGVCWNDIDLSKNKIHIRGTKTEGSDRYIPIFPELKVLLERIEYKGDLRLFHHNKYYVTSKFKEFMPNHKLHDLRHTFATRCLENGVSMKCIQVWLGHTRLDTTAMIYSHLLPDFEKSESVKVKIFI